MTKNDKNGFLEAMNLIISALSEAGYDPYTQLLGYVSTGEECYITRRNGARDVASTLDRCEIRTYIQNFDRA